MWFGRSDDWSQFKYNSTDISVDSKFFHRYNQCFKFANFAVSATVATLATTAFAANTPIRLEAEEAVLPNDHKVVVTEDAKASGGKFVAMKEGDLEFKVTVPATGYYTLWANYQLPTESGTGVFVMAGWEVMKNLVLASKV